MLELLNAFVGAIWCQTSFDWSSRAFPKFYWNSSGFSLSTLFYLLNFILAASNCLVLFQWWQRYSCARAAILFKFDWSRKPLRIFDLTSQGIGYFLDIKLLGIIISLRLFPIYFTHCNCRVIQVLKFGPPISSNIPIVYRRHILHGQFVHRCHIGVLIVDLRLWLFLVLILFGIGWLLWIKELASDFSLLAKLIEVIDAVTEVVSVFIVLILNNSFCKLIWESDADTATGTCSIAANRILSRDRLDTWDCTEVFHTQIN